MNNILRIAIGAVLLLLVPLVAMQFVEGMVWTISDFVIMGGMIFVVGLILDLVLHKAGKNKMWIALAVTIIFLWLWAELAVGVFTNWGS